MSRLPVVMEIVAGGPADVAGVVLGDELVAVNGVVPGDVIEYQRLVDESVPELTLRRGGVELDVVIDKAEGVPLGVRLDKSIFDRVQTCDNHCEFCFIYQLPPGMRKSLYLKDDDYRLSFLYGNFTTLTRFTELDLARVVEERLGPLYVSIHATDPDVRSAMLRNPRGATSLRWLRALLDAGTTVHGQVVLCPGINRGAVLERTLAEITARYHRLASVGVVPLGLSRFNEEKALRAHTPEEARADIEIIEQWAAIAQRRHGRRIFQASDELYLTAGIDFPDASDYEGFTQHENGIGMARAFYDELERFERGTPLLLPVPTGEWRTVPAAPDEGYRAIRHLVDDASPDPGAAVIVTGEYGAGVIGPVLDRVAALAGRELRLLTVRNDFFGGNTAVAGLLTGQDILAAVQSDTEPAGVYLIPDVALSGDRFLDEMSLADLNASTDVPVVAAAATVGGLLGAAA
ncbi:MAG: DUF512 domain-containing protein [Acidimicrobiia bacterium]|nr:DUF512 domain-containing protein [Acidimicrobiia bacterium]